MSNEEIKKTNRKSMQNNPNESENSDLNEARWANSQSRNQSSQYAGFEATGTMRASDIAQARQANAQSGRQSSQSSDMEAADGNGLPLSNFQQMNRINAQQNKANFSGGPSSSESDCSAEKEAKRENETSRQNKNR